jgi:hypothetical protein
LRLFLDVTQIGVRWLINAGHLDAIQPARDWLVVRESVEAYQVKRQRKSQDSA